MINALKFNSLIQLLDYFKDEESCKLFLEEQLYKGKPCCPYCGHEKVYRAKARFKCANRECHRMFSITVGTIFENSKIKLRTWYAAIYLISAHKKGISSCQLARDLNITQKTAWFMLHRVRTTLMENQPGMLLENAVEVDETYIGGQAKNKHKKERKELKKGTGYVDKTPVVGFIERGTKKLRLIPTGGNKVDKTILQPLVRQHVKTGALVITDGFGGYEALKKDYKHEIVNHTQDEYVRGSFHTNTIEGAFSILKRGIIGIYHQVSVKHLGKYCLEFSYRYSTRDVKDCERFISVVGNTKRRLKYADLIAA